MANGWPTVFIFSLLVMCLLLNPSCRREEAVDIVSVFEVGLDGPVRKILPLDDGRLLIVGGHRYHSAYAMICTTALGLSCQMLKLPFPPNIFSPMDAAQGPNGQVLIAGYGGQMYYSSHPDGIWEFAQQASYSEYEACGLFSDGQVILAGGIDRRKGFTCNSSLNWWSLECDSIPSKTMGVYIGADDLVLSACEGGVLISEDRGRHFQFTAVQGDLFRRFSFPDENNGFVIGSFGAVWQTSDGGYNWTRLRNSRTSLGSALIMDLSFFSSSTGVLAGTHGTLEITRNAGRSWQKLRLDSHIDLFAVHMINSQTLLAGDSQGLLYLIQF